ncbi:integrin alpha [Amylibacter sp.]|nr:integrin alpha [Amylibacter sp.]
MSNSKINLSTLIGTNGFTINGIDASDRSGYSVSSAGDVNGDGIDDLIIGAYSASPDGNFQAG